MKTSRFTETQIVSILKSADAGTRVSELCRKHGISEATYYKWKSKYGGMEASDIKRLKELEEENRKLKQMYAELSLDHKVSGRPLNDHPEQPPGMALGLHSCCGI